MPQQPVRPTVRLGYLITGSLPIILKLVYLLAKGLIIRACNSPLHRINGKD